MALLDNNLTPERFAELKKSGLTRKAIANRYNVSLPTLNTWTVKHREEIENEKIKLRVKPGPKTAKNDAKVIEKTPKTDENKQKIKELESEIAKLRVSLSERDRQVDELEASYKRDLLTDVNDLENKISQLENDKTDLEHQLAYTGQDRDRYYKLAKANGKQLHALEAYVLTILELEK